MLRSLPTPHPNFGRKKRKILEQLAVPDEEYTDASPKGSVDVGIRDLIGAINGLDGFVTTSSCAGRVSVFVEGRKAGETEAGGLEGVDDDGGQDGSGRPMTLAGVGGKGGGGTWLFVSHDPVNGETSQDMREVLHLTSSVTSSSDDSSISRLVHFKFEPMILHILTASPEHAQLLLKCGLQAGFRESGAINLVPSQGEMSAPIVAIRSMGLALESLVGVQTGDQIQCTVSSHYLRVLVSIANERFAENKKRIERFQTAILDATQPARKKDGTVWEDAKVRRERMRAEGLRKREELQRQDQRRNGPTKDEAVGMTWTAAISHLGY